MEQKSLKILFIGNSFAVDTMEHTVNIALSLGFEKVRFATLYVGGCSIGMHYEHAKTDAPVYAYFENTGAGWVETPNYKISDAVKSDEWDVIAIQHGTSGTSRYTSVECYEKLNPLIDLVNEWAKYPHKIAFNLTWLGESTYQHHEIISYGGNTALMREKLVEVTEKVVVGNEKIDLLVPTGTAIENARTSNIGLLTRDCYHLSMDKGRFIAGLTLVSTVTGIDANKVTWFPSTINDYDKAVAIESVTNAIAEPLKITRSKL